MQSDKLYQCYFASAPPSQVRNLNCVANTTSVILTWDRPAIPGRNDLQYNVTRSIPSQVGVFLPLGVISESSSTVVLLVQELIPDTTYIFKVSTQNGVSHNDKDNDALRLVKVRCTTGASGKPHT